MNINIYSLFHYSKDTEIVAGSKVRKFFTSKENFYTSEKLEIAFNKKPTSIFIKEDPPNSLNFRLTNFKLINLISNEV